MKNLWRRKNITLKMEEDFIEDAKFKALACGLAIVLSNIAREISIRKAI